MRAVVDTLGTNQGGIPAESFTRWDVMWNHQTKVNPEEKKFETPRWQEFDNTTKVW